MNAARLNQALWKRANALVPKHEEADPRGAGPEIHGADAFDFASRAWEVEAWMRARGWRIEADGLTVVDCEPSWPTDPMEFSPYPFTAHQLAALFRPDWEPRDFMLDLAEVEKRSA